MESGAAAAGTARYRDRRAGGQPEHYRTLDGLSVSSIGFGTYLGDESDDVDRNYGTAAVDAANLGCNLFDTAINYRAQRSERVLGQALAALTGDGGFTREQLVVCTKGGYIPFDGRAPVDPTQFVRDTYIRPGLLRPEDIVDGGHAFAPRFLADQITRSRKNLGLACLNVYYLHNPETQLGALTRAEFLTRIRTAFALLEEQVAAGRIGRYGVATWNGLRRPPDARDHLSLAELVREARAVAGDAHHFRVIQLPYNLAMPEAFAARTQVVDGERLTPLAAATRLGVSAIASAPILQGELARRLPRRVEDAFPGLNTWAQRALQFARSTPGVVSALVGMSRRAHVEENLAVAAVAPAPAGVEALFQEG